MFSIDIHEYQHFQLGACVYNHVKVTPYFLYVIYLIYLKGGFAKVKAAIHRITGEKVCVH